MKRSEFAGLCRNRLLRLDGATGTELIKRGLPAGVAPEAWILDHPEALCQVQQAYADAGSDILYAPTFGGNPRKLAEFGLADRCFEINRKLAELAKSNLPGKLIFGDIAPTGELVEPFGPLPFEASVAIYKKQIEGLLAGGVDGLVIETMMDLQEARAALIAARELCDLPVMVTLTFEPGGRTMTGTDPVAALVALQSLGADAFGSNCSTGPELMARVIAELKPYAKIPLLAKPNAGMPHLVNGVSRFELDPEPFAEAAVKLADAGAGLIGGCCGTTPEHIAALDCKLGSRPPCPPDCRLAGVVGSSSRICRIAPDAPFVLIGERINPTGKKALQAELRQGSLAMVKEFASAQTGQGASILDVNLGLAGIDETLLMGQAIGEICRTVSTPLAIDSTRPETVEKALRLYPGRALLNSISLEKERIEKILPVAAKYGAMPILLPLTDQGIPNTPEKRLEVLEKIRTELAKYNDDDREWVADALIMTISANLEAAGTALDFIESCRGRNYNTTGGLSNVSFGLPNRPAVNLTFLGMALGRGLNSAIANPAAPGIVEALTAADALSGKDPGLTALLSRFGENGVIPAAAPAPKAEKPEKKLHDAILRGRSEVALAALQELLASPDTVPGEIVDAILIPAITEVGEKFERKEFYLPQLMQSASAMQQAMARLEPHLKTAGDQAAKGPVFVLATVKGDIHDIGKNILALLLRNHHFEVIDLGKDVPAETIVETAQKHHAAAIGLSALMTTTMPQMRIVIELARARNCRIPVFVGGAAVDEEFASAIGAHYGADAMATVRKALELTGNHRK